MEIINTNTKKPKMPYGKNSHIDVIRCIAKGLNANNDLQTYLELGIRRGPCFNEVAPLVQGAAYAVDINPECEKGIKQNKNLSWFCGKSEDFLKNYDGNKFDLVFIDADHSYAASLKDFEMVIPHLHNNSIVCLHDTYPPAEPFTSKSYCFDVWKTAQHIKDKYLDEFEIVTLPFYFGVSVIRKCPKEKQLLWTK